MSQQQMHLSRTPPSQQQLQQQQHSPLGGLSSPSWWSPPLRSAAGNFSSHLHSPSGGGDFTGIINNSNSTSGGTPPTTTTTTTRRTPRVVLETATAAAAPPPPPPSASASASAASAASASTSSPSRALSFSAPRTLNHRVSSPGGLTPPPLPAPVYTPVSAPWLPPPTALSPVVVVVAVGGGGAPRGARRPTTAVAGPYDHHHHHRGGSSLGGGAFPSASSLGNLQHYSSTAAHALPLLPPPPPPPGSFLPPSAPASPQRYPPFSSRHGRTASGGGASVGSGSLVGGVLLHTPTAPPQPLQTVRALHYSPDLTSRVRDAVAREQQWEEGEVEEDEEDSGRGRCLFPIWSDFTTTATLRQRPPPLQHQLQHQRQHQRPPYAHSPFAAVHLVTSPRVSPSPVPMQSVGSNLRHHSHRQQQQQFHEDPLYPSRQQQQQFSSPALDVTLSPEMLREQLQRHQQQQQQRWLESVGATSPGLFVSRCRVPFPSPPSPPLPPPRMEGAAAVCHNRFSPTATTTTTTDDATYMARLVSGVEWAAGAEVGRRDGIDSIVLGERGGGLLARREANERSAVEETEGTDQLNLVCFALDATAVTNATGSSCDCGGNKHSMVATQPYRTVLGNMPPAASIPRGRSLYVHRGDDDHVDGDDDDDADCCHDGNQEDGSSRSNINSGKVMRSPSPPALMASPSKPLRRLPSLSPPQRQPQPRGSTDTDCATAAVAVVAWRLASRGVTLRALFSSSPLSNRAKPETPSRATPTTSTPVAGEMNKSSNTRGALDDADSGDEAFIDANALPLLQPTTEVQRLPLLLLPPLWREEEDSRYLLSGECPPPHVYRRWVELFLTGSNQSAATNDDDDDDDNDGTGCGGRRGGSAGAEDELMLPAPTEETYDAPPGSERDERQCVWTVFREGVEWLSSQMAQL